MKKTKILGYKVFYTSKLKYFIVLDEDVKVFDKKFQCIKTYPQIKYASYVAFDEKSMYVGTTQNLIYDISLYSLEQIKCYNIELSDLSIGRNAGLEIKEFLTIDDQKKLLITASALGAALILEFDIENEHTRVLNCDKDWSYNLYSLLRVRHEISLIMRTGGR